ncbi:MULTISPECIES: DUF418 domain-containing protein [unclassified Micromonospora]|uniref:DUF418 domain-containing protein n=1 Tax=unclassified Micromonospora TaxID=2617518 RepID=UPI0022B695F3|nr:MULTISPECIES: DUF418 domain-containing protein [unclassified Micromonospora]MCZ7421938.1 DUF418 domain-containing protein [Verrucosispora sp. WMMA2121]WBB93327.1 DUF418 domain-containing protein [Verrucosispora sp. WMMC514]
MDVAHGATDSSLRVSDKPPEVAGFPPGESLTSVRRAARHIGIDVARGCAVLGMFATHLGPQTATGWTYQAFNGRAAGLFALLAGVSVALVTGGSQPRTGGPLALRCVQLAVRAALLFLLGLGLTLLGTTIKEILTVYAVLFLVAIPLVKLPAGTLAVLAANLAITGPLLSFLLRSTVLNGYEGGHVPQAATLVSADGWAAALEGILITGPYPVLTWLPLVLAGMAVGRLDLGAGRVQYALLGGGAALAAGAYALSWTVMEPLGGWRAVSASMGIPVGEARTLNATGLGAVSTGHPLMLLDTAGHSGSPMEIFAVTGLALAVIGLCLVLARGVPVLLYPLASVGALPLTAYAGHIVLIAALQLGFAPGFSSAILAGSSVPLAVTVAVTLLALPLWRRFIGRGPLEWLLHRVSTAVTPNRG